MKTEDPARLVGPSDFFTGFFAALAILTPHEIYRCDTKFDQALAAAFEKFVAHSNDSGFEVTFSIRPHAVYGDSSLVQEGIAGAIRRALISLFNPTFQRFKLLPDAEEAQEILGFVPGGNHLYEILATNFLEEYKNSATAK